MQLILEGRMRRRPAAAAVLCVLGSHHLKVFSHLCFAFELLLCCQQQLCWYLNILRGLPPLEDAVKSSVSSVLVLIVCAWWIVLRVVGSTFQLTLGCLHARQKVQCKETCKGQISAKLGIQGWALALCV